MNTSEFLQTLIGTGPDASLNLFKIEISALTPLDTADADKFLKISLRTTQFVTPKRDTATSTIPYKNISLTIPTPGNTIEKSTTIPMRVDSGMNGYNLIRKYQLLNYYGEYEKDTKKKLKISVISFDSNFSDSGVYKWTFNDCYITSMSPLTYDYSSANVGTTNVSFIYSYFTEEFKSSTTTAS